MEITKNLLIDDYYKLRITSKKLSSGRFQVKFFATVKKDKQLYGYLLVEASETLKTVIYKIRKRLKILDNTHEYQHFHLYHIGKETQDNPNFLIFQ